MVANRYLGQSGPSHVSHTELSHSLIGMNNDTALVRLRYVLGDIPGIQDKKKQDESSHAGASSFDMHFKNLALFPEYYSSHGIKEAAGRLDSISAFRLNSSTGGAGTATTVWDRMNDDPEQRETFMYSMAAMSNYNQCLTSYDLSWVIAQGAWDQVRTLFVDVGGGRGLAMDRILAAFPTLDPRRCVVGDLEEVVHEARRMVRGRLTEVDFVSMDFHAEQPIKGQLNLLASARIT